MAKEFSRTRRVADQIQRHMAELIQMELGDPRVGMVTVTGVDVTHEFERARVYFTVLDENLADKEQAKKSVENSTLALNKAAGYLRTALARRLKLRTTPQLVFIYDSSMEYGNRLTDLIKQSGTASAEVDEPTNKPADSQSEKSE
ncbi:MAG: 30S ribosome-binding factor RbfA [Gammaproteobacteria bacterium]|nr:30S ribosome-binding factor RbfA [Gammaproteobacteria bacterium]MCF6260170.1 30S ribosome-binding factor RbfA [Gammaproteobacteria bacterium]